MVSAIISFVVKLVLADYVFVARIGCVFRYTALLPTKNSLAKLRPFVNAD
jgi:hypothetical protein